MSADRLAALEAVPNNGQVLTILRDRGVYRPTSAPWTLDGYELHCHPDLEERIGQLAAGLPGGSTIGLYGTPGLAANDIVYAVAMGMSTIHVRLPACPVRDEITRHSDLGPSAFGPDWVVADAWLSHLSSAAGTALLHSWLREAAAATRPPNA
jgi:hypothetical protein